MTRPFWSCLALLAITIQMAASIENESHWRFKRNKREVNFIQERLIQTLHPQPVLDTAKPEEKCCNTKQHTVGIALVNAYDSATGVLTNLFQFPQRSKVQFGKGVTQYLDTIGGRLVGLQR